MKATCDISLIILRVLTCTSEVLEIAPMVAGDSTKLTRMCTAEGLYMLIPLTGSELILKKISCKPHLFQKNGHSVSPQQS